MVQQQITALGCSSTCSVIALSSKGHPASTDRVYLNIADEVPVRFGPFNEEGFSEPKPSFLRAYVTSPETRLKISISGSVSRDLRSRNTNNRSTYVQKVLLAIRPLRV